MLTTTPTDPWPLPELTRARRAIVVVDVVESVRLMQEDEAGFIERWRRFVHQARNEVLPARGGKLVKSLGDGMLLEFERVHSVPGCAFELHRLIKSINEGVDPRLKVWLRIGVHIADVVHDDLDIYGAGVNLAARLAGAGQPGEVMCSAEFGAQLVNGYDCGIEDLGPCYFKHLDEPIHVLRLHESGVQNEWLQTTRYIDVSFAPRLAVMPLRPASDNLAELAIGELVCESLIARLAAADALRVVSRLSTSALGRRLLTVSQIGEQLQVAYVLCGSMRSDGTRLTIDLELCETRSETVLLTHRQTVAATELLRHDDEFSAEVAAMVSAAIVVHQVRRTQLFPLPTLEAFALQMSGTSLMHRAPSAEFARARDVLEALVERHPRSPTPRAWLAKWWVLRTTRGIAAHPADEAAQALQQTRTALDIDPECTLALAMEGFVRCHMQSDLDGAEACLRKALEMRPSESLAWLFMCVVQGFRGEGAAALQSAETALSLSPFDPLRHYYDALAASAAVAAQQPARAIELAQRALRANRNHLPTLRALLVAQAESGDIEAARVTGQRVLELAPTFTVDGYVGGAPKGSEATRQRYARVFREVGLP